MSVIGEIAAGKGVDLVLRLVTGGLREFFKQDALGRLLVLLHADFGTRTDLGRDVFYSWRDNAELESALRAVLGGQPAVDPFESRLTELIGERLRRTDPSEVPALAAEIADAVFVAAPYVADGGSQATALLLNRLEQGHDRIIESLSGGGERTPANLAHALVVGPLKHIGASDDVAEAERLANAGEHAAAVAVLSEVAERLDRENLRFAAENLRELAAAHLAASGAVDEAAELLLAIAQSRIDRGAMRMAEMLLPALRDIIDPAQAWLVAGVEARACWAERGDAIDALADAATASEDRADHMTWVAAHVELLALHERWDETEAAADVDVEPREGPVLQMILDGLDARQVLHGRDAVAERWLELLRWADTIAGPAARAVVWQRRGVSLGRQGEITAAMDAFRRATAAWALLPGFEEQAADAFYSMQAVALTNAVMPPDMDLRPLAWAVRGGHDTPVAISDRLGHDAMARRLEGKLPDAMAGYLNAYLIHRRVGSLQGTLMGAERLAELYAHAGEPGLAMSFYVKAGKGKEAAKAAAQMTGEAVAQHLDVGGARWERAAAWEVVAAVGRTLPPGFVAQIVDVALDEAEGEPDAWIAPQPSLVARRALAAISLALPPETHDRVFERLGQYMTEGFPDQMWRAAEALVLATRAGVIDARAALVARFVEDPANSRISWMWLAKEARDHEVVREALLLAARDGQDAALEPLAAAGLIGEDELRDRIDASTTRVARAVTVTRTPQPDGRVEISVGMGVGFEGAGVVARGAAPGARAALVARMIEILTTADEPELNKASAAGALFNMAPVLDDEQAAQVAAVVAPLALGQYEPSQFDIDHAHPLSRWQIRYGSTNQLRVSAIGTLAQLISGHPGIDTDPLRTAVREAIRSGFGPVVAAAFDAAARLPELKLIEDPEEGFFHPDAGVRCNALGAWCARNDGVPPPELVDHLVADESANVRLQLAAVAGAAGEAGAQVLARLSEDPDAFVRAKAAQYARGDGSED